MHSTVLLFSAFSLTSQALVARSSACALVFDGRIPQSATGASFDNGLLPYNPEYDLGANLTWPDVLRFPKVAGSLFDSEKDKAVEVTIDDRAVFTPSPTNAQVGFRRNELLPQPANATDAVTGIKTLHWSMRTDVHRPLNYSHEYQLVWLESQDYSANQFSLNTGTLLGSSDTAVDSKCLLLRGSSNASPQQTLWKTPFSDGVWHNVALQLDFNTNRLRVFYSTGTAALVARTKWIQNDLSNLGQYHFGVLKKPTGEGLTDITKQGYQESSIDEGVVYGGIFEEDRAKGCVSVAPGKKCGES